jgi:DsbC/DsbD-like thiol-disulfide interchange protein
MSLPRPVAPVLLAFLALLVILVPTSAQAQLRASPFREFREARVRLLGAREADGTFRGALDIRLMEGFKTYWKNAGDSGVPPQFDFTQSQGVSGLSVRLPLPERLDDGAGGVVFGYKQDVMFVLDGKAEAEGRLVLKLDFAVCGTLCIPLGGQLELDMARAPEAEPASVEALAATRARLPMTLGAEGVQIKRFGAHEFVIRLPYAGDLAALRVFPDAPAFFDVKEILPAGPGLLSLRLLAQPTPGKASLGPLGLTYGTPALSFERILDVDAAPP